MDPHITGLGYLALHGGRLSLGPSCVVGLGAWWVCSRQCDLQSKKLDMTQMCTPRRGKDVCELTQRSHHQQQEGLPQRRGEAGHTPWEE